MSTTASPPRRSVPSRRWLGALAAAALVLVALLVVTGNQRHERIATCQALLDDATGYAPLSPRVSAVDYARIYGRELHCVDLVKSGEIKGRIK